MEEYLNRIKSPADVKRLGRWWSSNGWPKRFARG